MAGPGEELLRRLTANDETAARAVLELRPEPCGGATGFDAALTTKIRMLVRLAALVALDGSTTSVRWAAELAACAGAGVDEIIAVLVAIGPDVGSPRVVSGASRLALAVGYEIDVDGWDGE